MVTELKTLLIQQMVIYGLLLMVQILQVVLCLLVVTVRAYHDGLLEVIQISSHTVMMVVAIG
ncbi:hypothetical protein EBZ80_27225 [bacterium]|nr:hypothetical protein [bacterium]